MCLLFPPPPSQHMQEGKVQALIDSTEFQGLEQVRLALFCPRPLPCLPKVCANIKTSGRCGGGELHAAALAIARLLLASLRKQVGAQIPDAIEHMYARKNTGKVTVTLPDA